MSLYEKERKRNPRRFRVDITSNIDPCRTCVISPYRHLDSFYKEHCSECPVNPDKEEKSESTDVFIPINVIFA